LYKIFANTLFIGQRLVFVPECHSTNSLASELATQSILSEGTVVITSNQTAGRGQRGNTWEATAGMNLTFSVLLNPTFLPIKNQFYLTMTTSLAVADFLTVRGVKDVKIKWPNDILVSVKKIGGILIENSLKKEAIEQSIVGIGLNINQRNFAFPTATSLAAIEHRNLDLNEALNSLLASFEKRYLQLTSGKRSEIKRDYLENLFGLGEPRIFMSEEKEMEGTIQDVNENGELIVLVKDIKKNFSLKQISFVL